MEVNNQQIKDLLTEVRNPKGEHYQITRNSQLQGGYKVRRMVPNPDFGKMSDTSMAGINITQERDFVYVDLALAAQSSLRRWNSVPVRNPACATGIFDSLDQAVESLKRDKPVQYTVSYR